MNDQQKNEKPLEEADWLVAGLKGEVEDRPAANTFSAAMSVAMSKDVLTVLRVAEQVVAAHRDTFQISDLACISARLRSLAAEVDQFVGWGELAQDNYDNEMHFLTDKDAGRRKTDFDVDFSRALAEVHPGPRLPTDRRCRHQAACVGLGSV